MADTDDVVRAALLRFEAAHLRLTAAYLEFQASTIEAAPMMAALKRTLKRAEEAEFLEMVVQFDE